MQYMFCGVQDELWDYQGYYFVLEFSVLFVYFYNINSYNRNGVMLYLMVDVYKDMYDFELELLDMWFRFSQIQ